MQKLSQSQRDYLMDAAKRYRESLPGSLAEEYLESRGLNDPRAKHFGLGYVEDPLPGHEIYRGCLSIPYMRWSQWRGWSAATMRFRKLDGSKPKYLSIPNSGTRLFNTVALTLYSKDISVTEGELDAVSAELAGVPAVGVPGASLWRPYFRELFMGYRHVNILADGDEAGMEFARTVAKSLPNARIIPMPDGEDVNSTITKQGKSALLERIS